MWRVKTFTGTVLQEHRFINTRGRTWARPVCAERRELWLGTGQDDEYKFTIHTMLMPARKSHCVTLVLAGSRVLGLYNATTGVNANYVHEDPPFLTRGMDLLVMLAILVVGGICAALGWLGVLQAISRAVAYLMFAMLCRLAHRKRLRGFVDEALNELHLLGVVRPLRRVDSGR